MNSQGNNIVRPPAVGMWCAIGTMALLAGCAYFNSPDIKRGDQHLAAGNWEEASLAYKQALKTDPFNPTLQSKYTMARERAAAHRPGRGAGRRWRASRRLLHHTPARMALRCGRRQSAG